MEYTEFEKEEIEEFKNRLVEQRGLISDLRMAYKNRTKYRDYYVNNINITYGGVVVTLNKGGIS